MSAALQVLMPADIRFPLERANGVQIVKTAAALAATGARTRLLVRWSDPRPTAEILSLYGVAAPAELEVRRLRVFHRAGSFVVPRTSFLLRAMAECYGSGGVVFTRDLQLADGLLRLKALGAPPVVYEAHAVESLLYKERGAIYGTGEQPAASKEARIARREARVWRRGAAIVTTTAGISGTFASLYGERSAVVIPNGCDVSESAPFPGLAVERPARVLYAGQLYPWKGVDVLVEAMAQVPGPTLVILGGIAGEADFGRVQALVQFHGLSARVEMAGTVPQARVKNELRRAAVVVVPFLKTAMTERHTSPLKAFEAMAAGRPIVASDLPSSREFLRDGENSLLVPAGQPKALAEALLRLLADSTLAERLARTAHAEAPQYSWGARGRRLRAVLESVR